MFRKLLVRKLSATAGTDGILVDASSHMNDRAHSRVRTVAARLLLSGALLYCLSTLPFVSKSLLKQCYHYHSDGNQL